MFKLKEGDMLKIGTSQIDVTPELPFPLAGSWHLREATSVNDPLLASSVVIDNGENSSALISCDLLMINNEQVADIRTKINKVTGIIPENIMVSCTHTHQGPIMFPLLPFPWILPREKVIKKVLAGIVESAIAANKNKQPARIGYGKGKTDKATFNRRYIMKDGHSHMHPPRGSNSERLLVEGPVDPEVQIIWFEDFNGDYIAILVNFSSHCIVLYDTTLVSADFPGAMRNTIQELLGKNIPILYLQGACGNTCPIDVENEKRVCTGIEGWKRVGRMVGGEVIKVLAENYVLEKNNITIATKNKVLSIPFREISSNEIIEAKKEWASLTEKDKEELLHARSDFDCPELFVKSYHDYSIIELDKIRKAKPYFPVELSVIRLDDVVFVTNSAELFVEFQLEIKKRFKDKKVLVVELANGYCGYVPTELALGLGGYETERSLGSRLSPEAGRVIVDDSIELIKNIGI